MVVSDGWGGWSWNFLGGLLMSSSLCVGLRKLGRRLLLVLSDGGDIVEEILVVFQAD